MSRAILTAMAAGWLAAGVAAQSLCDSIPDDIYASINRIAQEHFHAGKSKGAAFKAIRVWVREQDPPVVFTADQKRCWTRALGTPWSDRQVEIERQDRKRRKELRQKYLDSLKAKFHLDGEWHLKVKMNGYRVESLISARDTRLTIKDRGALRSRQVFGTIRSESDELAGLPGVLIELQIAGRSMKVKITRKSGRNDELTGACRWYPAEEGKPERLVGQLTGYKFHEHPPSGQGPLLVNSREIGPGPSYATAKRREPHSVDIGFIAVRKPATIPGDSGDDEPVD